MLQVELPALAELDALAFPERGGCEDTDALAPDTLGSTQPAASDAGQGSDPQNDDLANKGSEQADADKSKDGAAVPPPTSESAKSAIPFAQLMPVLLGAGPLRHADAVLTGSGDWLKRVSIVGPSPPVVHKSPTEACRSESTISASQQQQRQEANGRAQDYHNQTILACAVRAIWGAKQLPDHNLTSVPSVLGVLPLIRPPESTGSTRSLWWQLLRLSKPRDVRQQQAPGKPAEPSQQARRAPERPLEALGAVKSLPQSGQQRILAAWKALLRPVGVPVRVWAMLSGHAAHDPLSSPLRLYDYAQRSSDLAAESSPSARALRPHARSIWQTRLRGPTGGVALEPVTARAPGPPVLKDGPLSRNRAGGSVFGQKRQHRAQLDSLQRFSSLVNKQARAQRARTEFARYCAAARRAEELRRLLRQSKANQEAAQRRLSVRAAPFLSELQADDAATGGEKSERPQDVFEHVFTGLPKSEADAFALCAPTCCSMCIDRFGYLANLSIFVHCASQQVATGRATRCSKIKRSYWFAG